MPIHDYFIDNGTGANVRGDINAALSAIVSLNSNPTQPGTMYAYQLWADTTSNLLKIRNGGNSAWITLRQLDGDFSIVAVEDGLQATPSLTFTNDLNTGVFRSGADALAIVTGGQYAIACTSTQAVGIKTTNPNAALHVAGNTRVGADDATDAVLEIGAGASGNRTSYIDIVADTTYTDYGLRIIRNNTGANATSELKHRGTGALNFTTQEAAPIVFNTTNSPSMTITSGGLVGIGVPAPSHRLDVAGTIQSKNTINTVGQTADVILSTNNTNFGNNATATLQAVLNNTTTGANDFFIKQFNHNSGGSDEKVFQANSGDSGYVALYTVNTERARIDSSGRLLVYSSGNGILSGVAAGAGTSTELFTGVYSRTGTTTGGTASIIIYSNGNVVNTNNSYTGISDIKLKENIVDANSQWDDFKALQVRNYNFKEGQTHTQIGLVAQEVELVSPGLVNELPDRDAEGNDLGTVTKSVNYSVLYMKAVKALQEAMGRIEALEADVAQLKGA